MDVIRCLRAGPFDGSTLQRVRAAVGSLRREEKTAEVESHRAELLGLLDDFAKATAAAIVRAQAYLLAADLCDMAMDREQCVEFLALALDSDPSCRPAAHRLQAALSSSHDRPRLMALLSARIHALGAAEGAFDEATMADAYAQIGKIYAEAGELDRAIEAYNAVLDKDPDVSIVELLAELYVGRRAPGDVERAADLYCALYDVMPGSEGRLYLQRALALAPGHGSARARWAEGVDQDALPAASPSEEARPSASITDGASVGSILPPAPRRRSTSLGLGPPPLVAMPPPPVAMPPPRGADPRELSLRMSELPIAPPPAAGHRPPAGGAQRLASALPLAPPAEAVNASRSRARMPAGAPEAVIVAAPGVVQNAAWMPPAARSRPSPSSGSKSARPRVRRRTMMQGLLLGIAVLFVLGGGGYGMYALGIARPGWVPALGDLRSLGGLRWSSAGPSVSPGRAQARGTALVGATPAVSSGPVAPAVAAEGPARDSSGASHEPASDLPAPLVRLEQKNVRLAGGKVSRRRLLAAVDRTLPELARCYRGTLRRKPKLKGRLLLELRVRRSGAAATVRRAGGGIRDRRLLSCATQALKEARLPRLRRGRRAKVTLPFEFDTEE